MADETSNAAGRTLGAFSGCDAAFWRPRGRDRAQRIVVIGSGAAGEKEHIATKAHSTLQLNDTKRGVALGLSAETINLGTVREPVALSRVPRRRFRWETG
ncbi:MAG: hypothetical protein AAF355_04155 [Myxococcota bacterium]